MAISCVIPAYLNTNIQTPQLQNKPGKRGAEEAPHCVPQPPRAVQMANASGSRAAGARRRKPTGSRCTAAPVPTPAPAPPSNVFHIPLPGLLSPGPGDAEPRAAPPQGTDRVGSGSSSQKALTSLALDSDTAAQSGDEVVTTPLPHGTNDFCPARSPCGQPGIPKPTPLPGICLRS